MKLPVRSLRWRNQLYYGQLLLLVLTGFGAMIYHLQDTHEERHLDAELQLRAAALLGNIAHQPHAGPAEEADDSEAPEDGPPPGRFEEDRDPPPGRFEGNHGPPPGSFRLSSELAPLFAPHGGKTFYYQLWGRDGSVFGCSDSAPPALAKPAPPAEHGMVFRSRDGRRETLAFTPPGECLLVGISEAARQQEMRRFAAGLAGIGAAVLLLGLAGGWWLAARTIAPVKAIGATAARIAAGRLDERVPATGNGDELDQLAGVLNHTFAQLAAAFAEQARFTSDAAHELRTPVSVILAQTQLALARPRTAGEYRDTIESTRRAALRMQALIESLLTLAQLDAHTEPLRREPCDLAQVAREQLDLIRPLADERGIVLRHDLEPAVCVSDPERVAQICVNLLSNAVKYNRVGGEVHLASRSVNGHCLLSVSDTGPGIAAQHLPRLFDRFYRADASRNRNTGGAGLGLAICKTLAETQGGTLAVTSIEAQGSTFTLQLPRRGADEPVEVS